MQGGLADFVESRFAAGAKGGMHGAMADLLLLAHALSMDDSGAALRRPGLVKPTRQCRTLGSQEGLVSKRPLPIYAGRGVGSTLARSLTAGWWTLCVT